MSSEVPPRPSSRPSPLGEPLAFAASTGLVAAADTLFPGERSVGALLAALALGAGLGLLAGAVLRMLGRAPAALAGVLGAGAGVAIGYRAVIDLNALSRLDSSDRLAAQGAIAACTGVALGFALLVLFAAVEGRWRRIQLRTTRKRRTLGTAVLGVGAIGIFVFDRLSFPNSYPAAHLVAQTTTLTLFGLAASLAAGDRLVTWPRRRAAIALTALMSLTPLALLGQEPSRTSRVLLAHPFSRWVLLATRDSIDLDRDGFASRLGGGDCAAFDPKVHPGVVEIPGNGKDDDCLLGDQDHTPPPPTRVSPPPSTERPSIVLITIDSLRPDRMSLYGAAHATTPRIDAWARHATRFDRAYTVGGWTSIALSSMVRGTWARQLSWTTLHETNRMRLVRPGELSKLRAGEIVAKTFAMPIEDDHPTIGGTLGTLGYSTAAVLDDGFTGYFRKDLGGFPGFSRYRLTDERPPKDRNDKGTTDIALSVTKELVKKRGPFFIWIHYFGPHAPSQKHPEGPDFGGGVTGAYDAEIAFADAQIGRYLDYLDVLSREHPLAIILTADHGEEIASRSRAHGLTLREEALRIPMVARLPGLEPGVCDVVSSLADVGATVVDLAGGQPPASFVGRDLRSVCDPSAPPRIVMADTWRFDHLGRVYFDGAVATDGHVKATFSLVDMARGEWKLPGGDAEEPLDDGDPSALEVRSALDAYVDTYGAIHLND